MGRRVTTLPLVAGQSIPLQGLLLDTESQLYYLMSRCYDPVTHRFINADGYFQAGNAILDANMNAYCGNNPVNRFDPDGNCWIPTYSTCGAQMGSYWKTMQPVPGASYYCSKCGNCDPNYKSSLSNKKPASQPNPEPSYLEKVGQTIGAFVESAEFSMGLGYGLGLEAQLSPYFSVSALSKVEYPFTISRDGFDIGQLIYENFGISLSKWDFTLYENEKYNGILGSYSTKEGNVPNKVTILDVSTYIIVGGSVRASFNLDYYDKRYNEIWG